MIKKLLQLVSTLKVTHVKELAEKLETSLPLVKEILRQLIKLGYISTEHYDGNCCNCPLSGKCSTLDDKGISLYVVKNKALEVSF
ncbi:MAG: FeoC-like transcriptional regulator [Candidatus Odinarchaeia archaeon]